MFVTNERERESGRESEIERERESERERKRERERDIHTRVCPDMPRVADTNHTNPFV